MTANTTPSLPATTLRNAPLGDLVAMLREQEDVKYDVVVPASSLRYVNGTLHVREGATRWTDDGADLVDAMLEPTAGCEDGLAQRLDVPRAYLRRLREQSVALSRHEMEVERLAYPNSQRLLLDATVNAMLERDKRTFLVRGFRLDDPDSVGIARAILSDRYGTLDNYDVLLAALDGLRQAGLDASRLHIEADVSETNMRVRVVAPEVTALAPVLLRNYRSPYAHGEVAGRSTDDGGTVTDAGGNTLPVVQAGFVLSNSETGGGAFQIMPRLVVRICNNGMTIKADALRAVHLGGRLEEGIVRWSEQTKRTSLDLVVSKARDAVATFLDADYVAHAVEQIERKSGTPVDTLPTLEHVAKVHAFTETEAASILDCFIKSGDATAGGVMQAVTAAAQRIDDPERAAYFEDVALDVLATAAAAN